MSGILNLRIVALDSNLFIYHFENNPKFILHTDKIFKRLIKGKLKAVTSIVSLIETLSYPLSLELIDQITEDFGSIPNLQVFEVNQQNAVEAARIRREYNFRLPDAVQLATALNSKSQAFITNDLRLNKFRELKIIQLNNVS